MELCKVSLRQYAQKKRKQNESGVIPEIEIKRILRDVCLGL